VNSVSVEPFVINAISYDLLLFANFIFIIKMYSYSYSATCNLGRYNLLFDARADNVHKIMNGHDGSHKIKQSCN